MGESKEETEQRRAPEREFELMGVCGLYCGACYHYLASQPEGKHLREEAEARGLPVETYTCRGCRSPSLYVHPGCVECHFRDCARKRELIHCGECGEYPCPELRAFQEDERPHHNDVFDNLEQMKMVGPERWLVWQRTRWKCLCGREFSWYQVRCQGCGTKLSSYGPDPKHRKKEQKDRPVP